MPFFFFFNLLAALHGMWDLIPRPGVKIAPPALEVRSLNHWTAREVRIPNFWVLTMSSSILNTFHVLSHLILRRMNIYPTLFSMKKLVDWYYYINQQGLEEQLHILEDIRSHTGTCYQEKKAENSLELRCSVHDGSWWAAHLANERQAPK